MNERQFITVTNGEKLYKIAPEQLPQALAQGLSCPVASAQTLIGNGEYLFEIPVEDVQTANSDGFHDFLAAAA